MELCVYIPRRHGQDTSVCAEPWDDGGGGNTQTADGDDGVYDTYCVMGW